MADRRSSVGIIRGCGGAFGMTPALVDATDATLLSDEGVTSQAAILADYTSLPVTSFLGGAL